MDAETNQIAAVDLGSNSFHLIVARDDDGRLKMLDRIRERLEALIEEWQDRTTSKQRITGTRLHRELVEKGFEVGITLVRDYWREHKRRRAEVYIPLVHRVGEEAQVDFFEVTIEENGRRRKAWKFLMRLMYSGRDFAWI